MGFQHSLPAATKRTEAAALHGWQPLLEVTDQALTDCGEGMARKEVPRAGLQRVAETGSWLWYCLLSTRPLALSPQAAQREQHCHPAVFHSWLNSSFQITSISRFLSLPPPSPMPVLWAEVTSCVQYPIPKTLHTKQNG